MPTWGQLGCSGFVILDSELRVVHPSTAAYLDVHGAAFRDVESKLSALMSSEGKPEDSVPNEDPNTSEDNTADQQTKPSSSAGNNNCASGRCSLRTASDVSADVSTRIVEPLGEIQPTGVAAMDKEHEECARVLEELRDKRSLEALASVKRCLESHFAHEEQMLDESLYSTAAGNKRKSMMEGADKMGGKENGASGFSAEAGARKSHYADHARMLRAIQGAIHEAIQSSLGNAQDAPEGLVTEAFVDGLLRDFEAHASRYDDAYRVPAASA